jgi:hypothetical protein
LISMKRDYRTTFAPKSRLPNRRLLAFE